MVDGDSLPADSGWESRWSISTTAPSKGSRTRELPVFSVQFHPEASPGPLDNGYLFDQFMECGRAPAAARKRGTGFVTSRDIKSVLVLGSGPIVIGQAAEFDYAGTQACTRLREEGIRTILINSNPATIMTDEDMADAVYIEPLIPEVVRRVIQRERPDGLLPTLGGQTGLNLAVEVARAGHSRSLRRPAARHAARLDQGKPKTASCSRSCLSRIGEPAVRKRDRHNARGSACVRSRSFPCPLVDSAGLHARRHRAAASRRHPTSSIAIVTSGLNASPIHQVLLERSLHGLERNRIRGDAGRATTPASRSATWRTSTRWASIPATASSSRRRRRFRTTNIRCCASSALKIIRALRIEGGCNIQFALDPDSFEYAVIEVNPRVSRSSALASKATGYPIARMAAKIAIGKRLDEMINPVTGKTTAAFEPALDYCRRQDSALAVRQVHQGRPHDRHADEGDRRSDGDRPLLRRRAAEGGALAGNRTPKISLWEDASVDIDAEARSSDPATERRPAVGDHGRSAPGRDAGRDPRLEQDRSLVSDKLRRHRRPGTAARCSGTLERRTALERQAGRLLAMSRSRELSGATGGRRFGDVRDELGMQSGLQDGRHLRRRIRLDHAVLLFHL